MMQNKVAHGYNTTSTLAQRRRTSGKSTSALHVDQPMCRLGIAAYWFDSFLSPPLSKLQNVGYTSSVSTKPKCSSTFGGPKWATSLSSRRGGINENAANPTRASSVVHASVLRQRGYRSGSRKNSQPSATAVTTKCAVP